MKLTYQNIKLRNANLNDVGLLVSWWNDGSIMAHAGFPCGLQTTKEKVSTELSQASLKNGIRFMIILDDCPIGEMVYYGFDDGVAEIGIKICEVSKQNQGIGKIALSLLIEYLFEKGYQKIMLSTSDDNKRAQHVYEQMGFKMSKFTKEGFQDQLGKMIDVIEYALVKENFVSFIK